MLSPSADWRRAFCPGEDAAAQRVDVTAVAREVAEPSLAAARRPRLLDIDSLNVAVQRAIRKLTEHDEEFALLEPALADPRPAACAMLYRSRADLAEHMLTHTYRNAVSRPRWLWR